MAARTTFVCEDCGYAIEAWDDGNPYYVDESGRKCYAYHPDHENLSRCVGNDSPHLCLECGAEFMIDSEAPLSSCPKCQSTRFANTTELDGERCPKCKRGIFRIDPRGFAIS